MRFSLREEETSEYVTLYRNFLEEVQRLNIKVNDELNEVLQVSKYGKLQQLISRRIDVYMELVVNNIGNVLFSNWKEESGSLRACLRMYRAGESADEVCAQIEQNMGDLMQDILKIKKADIIITEHPLVSEDGMERLEEICRNSQTEIQNVKAKYISQVDSKSNENEIYGTLLPLFEGIAANLESFFKASLYSFIELHELVKENSAKLHNIPEENDEQFRLNGDKCERLKSTDKSKHCWQHEMTENSDSPKTQEFKDNFDDYVKPEDDYRGYRNQSVEVDARDITDNIPNEHTNESVDSSSQISNPNSTEGDIHQNEEEKGAVFDSSSESPSDMKSKVGDFESKVKAPEDYISKFDYDTQQKLENYYKGDGGKLTDVQKDELVLDLKSSYDSANKSERGDVLVPENSKDVTSVYYNDRTGKYDVGYDWKPVDTVLESRNMEVLKEGQQFDRVGPSSGRCTGAVGEDGSYATVKERSIPYHFCEDDITKEPSYHRYKAEQDFTKENLSNAIDNSMYSDDKKAEMHANLDSYYEKAQAKGYGYGDGLASGEIAPMFEDTTGATGGGKQYDMPFSMEELEDIGMISEVPKGTY